MKIHQSSLTSTYCWQHRSSSFLVIISSMTIVFGNQHSSWQQHQHQVTLAQIEYGDEWNNQCGVILNPQSNEPSAAPAVDEYEPVTHFPFYLQLMVAHRHVLQWIDDFTETEFHASFKDKADEDQGYNYQWLSLFPYLPYEILEMDDFLNQTYDRLHRFAIVFEYLVMENAASLKYFQDKFNEMRIYNRLTLCELDTVLIGVANDSAIPRKTRAIMPQVLRNLHNKSDCNMRNFRIFKDYLKALEYTMKGLYHYVFKESKPNVVVDYFLLF